MRDDDSYVPFSFIATCLIVGASFSLDGYFHDVSVESFGMAFDEGDNNNGRSLSWPMPWSLVLFVPLT